MCEKQNKQNHEDAKIVATLVLWHLERMGCAASAQIPLEYDGKNYVISIGVTQSSGG